MTTRSEPTIVEPDYGPLLAIAEVTRLALEHDATDIARGWTAIAERLMQPIVLMPPIYEESK